MLLRVVLLYGRMRLLLLMVVLILCFGVERGVFISVGASVGLGWRRHWQGYGCLLWRSGWRRLMRLLWRNGSAPF